MTDKELLERAAKAYGNAAYWEWDDWNPLTDDGDALRLAVKLRLELRQYLNQAEAYPTGCRDKHRNAEYYTVQVDPYAATRRAIVRAAAELGKG